MQASYIFLEPMKGFMQSLNGSHIQKEPSHGLMLLFLVAPEKEMTTHSSILPWRISLSE